MKQLIFIAVLIFAFSFAAFAQAIENPCPQINILTLNESVRTNEFVYFIAEASKEINKYEVKYNWIVYNLEIFKGQGTKILQTIRKKDDVGYATLHITGLPENCRNTYTEAIPPIDPPLPMLFDEFGKNSQGDKKARMDNFLSELQNEPSAKGLIVISNDQNSVYQIKFLSNYIQFRKFDKTKISFLITDEIINLTRLFIIPEGAHSPNFNNSLVIKAEDFDKLENFFRPKPTTQNRKK